MTSDTAILNKRAFELPRTASTCAATTGLEPAERSVLATITPKLGDGLILDIGIGAGRTTPALSALATGGRTYVGVDFSSEMIRRARQRFPGLDLRVMDARDLSALAPGSAALAWFSFNGIDYVDHEDRLRVLAEVGRVLSPDGTFVFSSHNRSYRRLEQSLRPARPSLSLLAPVGSLRALVGYARNSLNAAQLRHREVRTSTYAILNDSAYDHRLLTYYISPADQVAQLAEARLTTVAAYDIGGHRVRDGSAAAGSYSVHYVARRA